MVNTGPPLVVDAHVLAAYLETGHPAHHACRRIVESGYGPCVVPWMCAAGAARILERRRRGAEPALASALADGLAFNRPHDLVPVAPDLGDLLRIQELQHEYRWIGFVEAAVLATTERTGSGVLATSDRRYELVRPGHVERLRLMRPAR